MQLPWRGRAWQEVQRAFSCSRSFDRISVSSNVKFIQYIFNTCNRCSSAVTSKAYTQIPAQSHCSFTGRKSAFAASGFTWKKKFQPQNEMMLWSTYEGITIIAQIWAWGTYTSTSSLSTDGSRGDISKLLTGFKAEETCCKPYQPASINVEHRENIKYNKDKAVQSMI